MLNVNKIAAIAVKDYYARMAKVSKDRSYWYGLGSISLGYQMHQTVDPNALYALCALGKKAAAGIAAGEDVKAIAARFEAHQAELERSRRAGYDLSIFADKSAALAYLGHPDEAVRNATLLAHQLSVNTALRFIEDKAGLTRVMKNGEIAIVKAEMVEAVFTHFTNRDLEPLLHSHVILPNVVHCEDGEWRALHNDELYRWYMAAGAVYRATFRTHMRRLTTAEFSIAGGWKSRISGLADWEAPDGASLLEAYSRRRHEVVDEMERRMAQSPTGTISPKLKSKLGVMTRKEKDFGDGDARIDEIATELRETLTKVWGLGADEWKAILEIRPDPRPDIAVNGLWLAIPEHLEIYGPIPEISTSEQLSGYMSRVLFDEGGGHRREGVLAGRAYVSVQDLHKSVYDNFGGFVGEEMLTEALSGLLSGQGVDDKLRLVPIAPAVYVKGRKAPLSRVPIRYYATRGVLTSECAVLEMAGMKTASAVLSDDTVNSYLLETIKDQRERGGFVLSEEQRDALRHLFVSETSATLLMGAQGSGKTTMFSHFSRLAHANDIAVWGLAPTGTAAEKLGATLRQVDSNAQALTIESFVGQALSGSLRFPKNLCVILDESSQADTLELAETLDVITKCGAKLILVGDDRQLGSVRYGGMFATLFAKLGGARLTETRRAADAWDRTAQAHLRMGDLREALRVYEQAKRITVCDDGGALTESIVGWLDKEFRSNSDAFVITNSTREEMLANVLAHQRWGAHRAAWVKNYLDTEVKHHRLSRENADKKLARLSDPACLFTTTYAGEGLVFHPGDFAAVRRSLKSTSGSWLRNGTRARVLDVTDKAVVLLVQDESSARQVKVSRALLSEHPGSLSYGWASTVYRTQSMELGNQETELSVADSPERIIPDTPVRVKRTTFRSKSFSAEFLEDKAGEKIVVRMSNGKVRTVSKDRVFLDPDTKQRIESLIVNAREGNALVVGTETMSLDSLLVAASRARQRTDFLFRSVRMTEGDYMTEKLLADASDEELARATMSLYVARQSRPEEPDSAYLRLARERETVKLAATVDLDTLGSLRLWLADNLTSGTLDVSPDRDLAISDREAAQARLTRLEDELATTDDADKKAHLAAEIDGCASQIGYARREVARLEIFAEFIGHAEGALSDKTGRVVVDQRYVADRMSLVDDAISLAEDKQSWVEIAEAIEVPLPENTAREVVDVSAKDEVNLDTRAKLFSCVDYRIASSWMNLAEALYDRALAEALTPEEVIASVKLADEDRARLREAFSSVAANRAHPTSIGHPITLRQMREEALSDEVDPELVAAVERITESLSEQDYRHVRREAEDRDLSGLFAEEVEDELDEVLDAPPDGEGGWGVTGDEPVYDDDYFESLEEDEEDGYIDDYRNGYLDAHDYGSGGKSARAKSEASIVRPAVASEEASEEASESGVEYWGEFTFDEHTYPGFFYKDPTGVWCVDHERRLRIRDAFLRDNPCGDDSDLKIDRRREIEPGSGEWYDPELDTTMTKARTAAESEADAMVEEFRKRGRGPSSYGDGGPGGERRGGGLGFGYHR